MRHPKVPQCRCTVSRNHRGPVLAFGKTDWDIDRIGDITVNFLKQRPRKRSRSHSVSIAVTQPYFQEDCRTAVDESRNWACDDACPSHGNEGYARSVPRYQQGLCLEPNLSEIDSETGKISTVSASIHFGDRHVVSCILRPAAFVTVDA
jgi:hypothetical protein